MLIIGSNVQSECTVQIGIFGDSGTVWGNFLRTWFLLFKYNDRANDIGNDADLVQQINPVQIERIGQ